jgi:hypothetical protein
MNVRFIFSWIFVVVLCEPAAAQPSARIIGGSGSEANSFSLVPFSYGSSRYQQVYSSLDFPGTNYGIRGFWISNIAFRVDGTNGRFWQGTYSSIQINLSTTQKQPHGLSSVFAENIGPDETVVFGPASQSVLMSYPSSPGTFDFRINFSQGFLYEPDVGNLLLDIRMLGNGIWTSPLDASRGIPFTSSVFSQSGGPAGTLDNAGLVARIGGMLVPVPEPSTATLFGVGLLLFLCSRKRKQH